MTIKHWTLGDMEKAEKLAEMVRNFFSSAVNDMKKYKIDVIGVEVATAVYRLDECARWIVEPGIMYMDSSLVATSGRKKTGAASPVFSSQLHIRPQPPPDRLRTPP